MKLKCGHPDFDRFQGPMQDTCTELAANLIGSPSLDIAAAAIPPSSGQSCISAPAMAAQDRTIRKGAHSLGYGGTEALVMGHIA